MDGALYRLLNQECTKEVTLRGQALMMTLLTAQELLELRLYEQAAEDTFSKALQTGAALAAKSLKADGAQVFSDAEEVLNTLSAEEINSIVAAYRRWSGEIDPGFGSGDKDIDELKKV